VIGFALFAVFLASGVCSSPAGVQFFSPSPLQHFAFTNTQASRGLDEFMELSSVPATFRMQLVTVMVADTAGAWLVDRVLRFVFPLQRASGIERLQ
jgi:hypothetical protein